MSTRRAWGRLVAREVQVALPLLLAGCSPPPPVAAVSTATLAPPSGASVEPPAAAAPVEATITPLASALTAEQSARRPRPTSTPDAPVYDPFQGTQTTVRYGRGVLTYVHFQATSSRMPICPIRGASEPCAAFTITSTGQSPADGGWSASRTDPAPGKKKGPFVAQDWTSFSPGRDGVYASNGSGAVDFIDDLGNVTRFLEDEGLSGGGQVHVFEAGAKVLVAFASNENGLAFNFAEAIPGDKDRPRKLGKAVEMPMIPVPTWRVSAQGARMVEEQKKAAMYGAPVFMALPDAKEKDAWGVAWVEALPPPYKWPAGKAYKRPGKRKLGAKNDCGGGPSSRSLSDPSVEKRFHLTRFSGGKLLSDVIVGSSNTFNESQQPLLAAPTADGFELNGVSYDLKGKKLRSRPVEAAGPAEVSLHAFTPDEEVVEVAFDASARRGLLLLRAGGGLWSREFDDEGKFLGNPAEVTSFTLDAAIYVSWSGERWYLYDRNEHKIAALGEATSRELAGKVQFFSWHSAGSGAAALFERQESWLSMRSVSLAKGQASEPSEIISVDANVFSDLTAVFPDPSRRENLQLLTTRRREHEGVWSSAPARAGASWEALWEVPKELRGGTTHIHHVWGDTVLVATKEKKSAAFWVSSRKTVAFDEEATPLLAEPGLRDALGPLLNSGERLLPAKAGPPIELPQFKELGGNCGRSFATGPQTLVLVCGEAVDTMRPGIQIGLRTVKLPQK